MPTNHPDEGLQPERPPGAARRTRRPTGSSLDNEALQRERPPGAADVTADRPRPFPACPDIRVDARPWRTRHRWALLVLAVLGCLLFAWMLAANWRFWFGPVPDIRPDEVAIQRTVAEALPLGSTKEQVEAWLKGQGLRYGTLLDGAGGKPIGFGVRTPYSKGFLSGEYRMEFYFDSDGKLIKEIVSIFIPSL